MDCSGALLAGPAQRLLWLCMGAAVGGAKVGSAETLVGESVVGDTEIREVAGGACQNHRSAFRWLERLYSSRRWGPRWSFVRTVQLLANSAPY